MRICVTYAAVLRVNGLVTRATYAKRICECMCIVYAVYRLHVLNELHAMCVVYLPYVLGDLYTPLHTVTAVLAVHTACDTCTVCFIFMPRCMMLPMHKSSPGLYMYVYAYM